MTETVFVAVNAKSGSVSRYHTSEDCTRLKQFTTVVSKERDAVEPHLTLCKWCDGFTPEENGGIQGPSKTLLEANPEDIPG